MKMSSFTIDRSLLSTLVSKHDLESTRNAVRKHKIWEEIADEYSGITGDVISGKQVAKAWNNTKYRQRSIAAAAAAAAASGQNPSAAAAAAAAATLNQKKSKRAAAQQQSYEQLFTTQGGGGQPGHHHQTNAAGHPTKIEIPSSQGGVTLEIPETILGPGGQGQGQGQHTNSGAGVEEILNALPTKPIAYDEVIADSIYGKTIINKNCKTQCSSRMLVREGVFSGSPGYEVANSADQSFEQKLRLKEHELFMMTLHNENKYWSAKANSAEAEEKKMALELAMVEETAKTKGIFFETTATTAGLI